jgi:hypothetical protein
MGESPAHFASSSRGVVLVDRSRRAHLGTPLIFHPATMKLFAGRALTFHLHLGPQTYAKVNCQTFTCEAASFSIERLVPDGAVGPPRCECAQKIKPEPPKDEDLDWKWCSNRDETCECKGRVRFGHTGLERHYENDSAFFKKYPDLVRHVSRDVEGSVECHFKSFPGETTPPWFGHEHMKEHLNCQCAELPGGVQEECVLSPPSPSAPPSPPPIPEPPGVPEPPKMPAPPDAPPPPNPNPPPFPPLPAEVPDLVYIEPELLDEPGDPPELPDERDPEMLEADTKASEMMEEVSIDVLPGVKPWLVKWEFCAQDGEDCDCPGTIRYGHAGYMEHYLNDSQYFKENPHVVRWLMRMGYSDKPTECTVEKFGDRDPFPDIPREDKICLCAAKVKPYQYKITGVTWGREYDQFGAFFEISHEGGKYEHCANQGEFCKCDGTVRIGQPSHAVPNEAYPAFWKQIFLHHNDLHKVQGRWFLRAPNAHIGGVMCDKKEFYYGNNKERVDDATADEMVNCQCLAGGPGHHSEFYPEGVVDEEQLISLDSIKPPGKEEEEEEEQAQLAASMLAQDKIIAKAIASAKASMAAARGSSAAATSSSSASAFAALGSAQEHHHKKHAKSSSRKHSKSTHAAKEVKVIEEEKVDSGAAHVGKKERGDRSSKHGEMGHHHSSKHAKKEHHSTHHSRRHSTEDSKMKVEAKVDHAGHHSSKRARRKADDTLPLGMETGDEEESAAPESGDGAAGRVFGLTVMELAGATAGALTATVVIGVVAVRLVRGKRKSAEMEPLIPTTT